MSKYLNVFNTLAEYQAFSASTEYVQPNVALVKETNVLYYDYGNNKPQVDMSDYKVESQETSVGGDKYGTKAITKIHYIPSSITSLKDVFSNYSSLEEVTCKIPDTVTSMEGTFRSCKSLVTAPEIPSGVTNMKNTFSFCSSLVNAPVIPSGVTNMFQTFSYCDSLITAPAIPCSVTSMTNTFTNCNKLKEATFLHTTPPSYSSQLFDCRRLESIYVPDESVDAYKAATGWSQFASMIKPLSEKPSE